MSILLWWVLPSLVTCLALMNCLRADDYPPEEYDYWDWVITIILSVFYPFGALFAGLDIAGRCGFSFKSLVKEI